MTESKRNPFAHAVDILVDYGRSLKVGLPQAIHIGKARQQPNAHFEAWWRANCPNASRTNAIWSYQEHGFQYDFRRDRNF